MIGRAGAGKTTVAVRLGEALGLPVIHLDKMYWDPGWQPADPDLFDARHAAAIAEPAWVVDGGYLSSRSWQERLRRSDLVVVVEAPLVVCLWRILRRSLWRPAARRPDLPDGCTETLSLFFVWWTIGWSRRHRRLAGSIAREHPGVPVTTTRSTDDPHSLIAAIRK